MKTTAKRRAGRPPKDPTGAPRRAFISTRIRDLARDALEIRAARNQRSVSEEVERIVEDELLDDRVFSAAARALSREVLMALNAADVTEKTTASELDYERAIGVVVAQLWRKHPNRTDATKHRTKEVIIEEIERIDAYREEEHAHAHP